MKVERQLVVETPRNFKLLHQILCISSIDFDSQTLFGYTELAVLPLTTNMRSIRLNCSKQCRINRITVQETIDAAFVHEDPFVKMQKNLNELDPKLRSVDLLRENFAETASTIDADCGGGELLIKFPSEIWKTVDEQKLIRIGVDFNLEKPTAGLQFVPYQQLEGSPLKDRGAHLFTWKRGDSESRMWFPCADAPSELCSWKIEITCDVTLAAICSGELQEVVYTSDLRRKTFHYYLSIPSPACNIGLSVGPYDIYVHPEMNELTAFCLPQLMSLLRHTCRSLHKVCEFFEELLSSRYPYGSFKLVFVDELPMNIVTYSSLAIMHTKLLYHKKIIDQAPITRRLIAYSVARQFFGCYVVPMRFIDGWVAKGLAEYIGGLYIQRFFGNNEYLHQLYHTVKEVIDYESKFGGVVLHPNDDAVRNSFHFDPTCPMTCSTWYKEVYVKKSFLVIRILEKKLGKELLLQVMNKLLSVAAHAAQQRMQPASWTNILLSTESFLKCVSNVTGQDLQSFIEQWVTRGGHAEFVVSMSFNRKRNMIELEVRQDLSAKGAVKYVGPVTIAVQELDGSFSHTLQIDDTSSRHDIQCHSKARRQRKRKIPLWTGEEVDMDLSCLDPDSPLLWLRFDPELLTLSRVNLHQPDYQWQYQLKHERDVIAQLQALAVLPKYPSPQTRLNITDIIKNEQCFYRVRCLACFALAQVANKLSGTWSGPPAMFNLFSTLFGSKSCPNIPRLNNFSNFQHYFLSKAIISAMARLKNSFGLCPPEVHQFLLDLLKFNNNSQNKFADDYYRACILEAIGKTAAVSSTGGGSSNLGSSMMGDQTTDSILSQVTKTVSELVHALNLEKIKPTYSKVVTIGCLIGLNELLKANYLNRHSFGERTSSTETDLTLWWSFLTNESFSPVRQTAADCIVELLVEHFNSKDETNLFRLLDVVTDGSDATLRFYIVESFLKKLTFSNEEHRNVGGIIQMMNSEKIFEKLWSCFVSGSFNDLSVKCTLLDVCFSIFGRDLPSFAPGSYSAASLGWSETGVYSGRPDDSFEQPIVLDDSFTESI